MAIENDNQNREAAERAARELGGWEKATPEARLHMLDRSGREIARQWEAPAPPAFAERFEDERLLGEYDDGNFRIDLNERLLEQQDPAGALEAWTHEYEHSRQAYEIQKSHLALADEVEDSAQVREWEIDSRDYIDPREDEVGYYNQVIESDARNFAAREAGEILEQRRKL